MRLAVSNIAWRPEESEAALDLLTALSVPGLEIAPGLTFVGETDPMRPTSTAVDHWQTGLDRRGLTLVSMQSLLFGSAKAALFGDVDQRAAFETGMEAAIELADRLGCPNLVFGSPGARRIPDSMDPSTATAMAHDVLGRLGDRCRTIGASLSVEPVPTNYGTNFLNTFAETDAFVRALDHPSVRVNLDLGALMANGETDSVMDGLPVGIDRIGHVHISEPELAPAPADAAALAGVVGTLTRAGRAGWASIEMRSGDGDNLARLQPCVIRAQAALGDPDGASA